MTYPKKEKCLEKGRQYNGENKKKVTKNVAQLIQRIIRKRKR